MTSSPRRYGDPSLPALEREEARELAAAIEALPFLLKRIVALRYQEDCSLREIGAVLGLREVRVLELLAEARRRLHADLGRIET